MSLKGREREKFVGVRLVRSKELRRNQIADHREIIFLVRCDAEAPARHEHTMNSLEKRWLHYTSALVFLLRPGIRKEQMDDVDGFRRKQILDGITALDAKVTHVCTPSRVTLRHPRKTRPPSRSIPKEIAFRKFSRQLRHKAAVAATEIDFEDCLASENLFQIEGRKIILRNQFDIGKARRIVAFLPGFRVASRNSSGIFDDPLDSLGNSHD